MHSVINLSNGDKVMIQEAAGYQLETKLGEKVTAIDLDQMRSLHIEKQLSPQERLHMMEMFLDGFRGVKQVHDKGFIHRDLKEENMLVMKDGHGVLSDFGTVVGKEDDPKKAFYIGTPRYSAPETFKYDNNKYEAGTSEKWNSISQAADIWSCGMMVQNNFIDGKSIMDHESLKYISKSRGREFPEPEKIMITNRSLDSVAAKKEYEKNYLEPQEEDYKKRAQYLAEHLVWSSTRIDPTKRPTMEKFIESFEKLIEEKRKEIE